jgi:hypothetical protein
LRTCQSQSANLSFIVIGNGQSPREGAFIQLREHSVSALENDYIDQVLNNVGVEGSDAEKTLDVSRELQITVIGRETRREHSTPVWFVREGKTVFLLPVRGSKNQWYRNILKSRRIKISSGKLSFDLSAKPIVEEKMVGSVIDKFRKKYGAADVKRYYSVLDAAIELTLP